VVHSTALTTRHVLGKRLPHNPANARGSAIRNRFKLMLEF
jgi:hypothetical protein